MVKNSDSAEETIYSSPQACSLLPALTRFKMPPLGRDGQCDKTLKNAIRLDGRVNKSCVLLCAVNKPATVTEHIRLVITRNGNEAKSSDKEMT